MFSRGKTFKYIMLMKKSIKLWLNWWLQSDFNQFGAKISGIPKRVLCFVNMAIYLVLWLHDKYKLNRD